MKPLVVLLWVGVTWIAPALSAQTPDAAEIMRRVSENVGRAEAARAAWVYDQDVFVRLKRANGKLAREESRQYTVAPTEKGAQRKLVKVEGKILEGKKEVAYSEAGYRQKDADIDGALVDTFAREIMWRRNSVGPMVYRITFREKGDAWEGEAPIERNEFQPVLVTSAWTGKVPAAVTTYKRFDKDVWFPVRTGGELKLRVLFLCARTIAFSAANRDFRKTDEFSEP
jgi:hypothetical protein